MGSEDSPDYRWAKRRSAVSEAQRADKLRQLLDLLGCTEPERLRVCRAAPSVETLPHEVVRSRLKHLAAVLKITMLRCARPYI